MNGLHVPEAVGFGTHFEPIVSSKNQLLGEMCVPSILEQSCLCRTKFVTQPEPEDGDRYEAASEGGAVREHEHRQA
jgi:hypothetical protein